MRKSWSKILGKKTWDTVSEEVLRRNSAAFAWLEEVAGMATPPARFDDALFSALCPPLSLISRCDDDAPLRDLNVFRVLPSNPLPTQVVVLVLQVCMRSLFPVSSDLES